MSVSVLYMSISLDGYIAGPNDEVGNPGGDGFDRLHEWFGDFSRPSGAVENCGTNGTRRVQYWRDGVPWSRSITGVVIIRVFRSSCPATGHRVLRWRTIR